MNLGREPFNGNVGDGTEKFDIGNSKVDMFSARVRFNPYKQDEVRIHPPVQGKIFTAYLHDFVRCTRTIYYTDIGAGKATVFERSATNAVSEMKCRFNTFLLNVLFILIGTGDEWQKISPNVFVSDFLYSPKINTKVMRN